MVREIHFEIHDHSSVCTPDTYILTKLTLIYANKFIHLDVIAQCLQNYVQAIKHRTSDRHLWTKV